MCLSNERARQRHKKQILFDKKGPCQGDRKKNKATGKNGLSEE